MPKLNDITQLVLECARFATGFRRSVKGNLWREWEGSRVVIIKRNGGGYGWMIVNSDDEKRFSPRDHKTEQAAIDSVSSQFIF